MERVLAVLIASQCPSHPQDTAEAYLLGHMPEGDAEVFRKHSLECPVCQRSLREEAKLIRAFRSAGRMIAAREMRDGRTK